MQGAEPIDWGPGSVAWRVGLSDEAVELAAHVTVAGTLVVTVDTSELAEDRVLRVNVNDGPVFSARPHRGDHDPFFISGYAGELVAAGALDPVVLRRDPERFVAWWRSLEARDREEIRDYARDLSEQSAKPLSERGDCSDALHGLMSSIAWSCDELDWIVAEGLPEPANPPSLYVVLPEGRDMQVRVSARVVVDGPDDEYLEYFWLRWTGDGPLMPAHPLRPCALTWLAHVADTALALMTEEAALEDRLLAARLARR
ncbi:hypothetical protein [Tsukamurella hominis]|uniref:hypothetical protein n=1 Tax=Tsukamurella hominis TaxID=1970232 RepID=UPI0039EA61C9